MPAARRAPFRRGRLLLATTLLAGLAACGTGNPFDRDPQISGMEMSPETMPEAASVRVPMPPPEPTRVKYRAEAASLWERGSGGFFGDQRASKVGDILTIDVAINDGAKLRNATERSRGGGSTLAFPKLFGYGTQIDKILPGVGPDDLPQGDLVDLSSSTQASGSGSINRNETINLRIAALVVKKLPNGNLVVAGRQEVKVNQELRELRVAGIIRPEDVQMNNTISYDKMAEARIAYGGRGQLSRAQTRGYGEDVMDIILPY
ncbi:flagellar basal body L-ring protein [Brevirhabdus pacifica]|uniref:Flagellar L-ring protein n=1 Tax=Brevirhabdus pacifica TaxID=1267768 RepID=A0A1U7DLV2_9RHOB|nr:flagellar basal body L-ring protein [Brevirhabdus pacifica]OWU76924.1 flagellar L-ring protein FlgH [Loktanella sp. 22II-4b]